MRPPNPVKLALATWRVCGFLVLPAAAAALISRGLLLAAPPGEDPVQFFERRVRPVLVEKCQKCHDATHHKGGLRLDSREGLLAGGESGPVVNRQDPLRSELIRAINYEADGFQMPPTGKLDSESIRNLTEWIVAGTPWPASPVAANSAANKRIDFKERARHWSFQPLGHTVAPSPHDMNGLRNPIDAFITTRLESAGLRPALPAEKRTLLRRLTFDLVGLPPTRQEIHDFLADAGPLAYERVVDRLLASPHYGERWGRHWLDVVRYAESYGHEFDFDIPAPWPYRDYVIHAWNQDLPYDQFVTEHIAGDLLDPPRRKKPGGDNESVVATAFWWFGQAKHSPVDLRAEECDSVDNQIDVFSKGFLGLSVACARCHDHKFDPIRADDYYALAGFLRSSRQQLAFTANDESVREFCNWRRQQTRPLAQQTALALESISAERLCQQVAASRSAAFRPAPKGVEPRGEWELFEDFSHETFAGWQVSGPAFGDGPARAGDVVVESGSQRTVASVAPPKTAHSGILSPKLRGTLRSRSFLITRPYIHYRACRRAGRRGDPLPFKTGQLNLIVDNFQIIRAPLYGGLSIELPDEPVLNWHTQDVSKFLGQRAYIEIADEDDGWLAVDRIVFSADSRPPDDQTDEVLRALLDGSLITRGGMGADACKNRVIDVLQLWKSGRVSKGNTASLDWLRLLSACRVEIGSGATRSKVLDELQRREQGLSAVPRRTVAMVDGTAENEQVLVRGNPKKPGREVPRRFLEVFGATPVSQQERGSGRLDLARSLTSRAAALLARVAVNRLWHHHFGRGLVATPDDFGRQGSPPSHPQLLDLLAGELIRSGWSIKHVQRLIVLSGTYRQSSHRNDGRAESIDPDNHLLHRMPVRRLEAEAIRDAILAVSGRLDERMDGPPVRVHLSEFMTGRGRPQRSGPLDGEGRRSLYLTVRRNFLSPLLLAFDFPSPATTRGRRGTSNVPAQALALMNDPFPRQQAEMWGRRLHPLSDRQALAEIYETAFARLPTADEANRARHFLSAEPDARASDRWADFCHVLMNVKEFIFIE